ncbi:MAG: GH92 family glycosyl hydrolase [Alphaproteobacteria bacterium]|nr:GH92 family glycosyl hydrolase [Alphaproteobacteria bacterium]
MRILIAVTTSFLALAAASAESGAVQPASEVNPFIGTANGGNTYPGATLPLGMVAFSPEETPLPGRSYPIAAPGGYEWRSNGIRGFSLTHLSGTGCLGASGDVPIMPVTVPVERSPSTAPFTTYSSLFSHDHEAASPGWYQVTLGNGVAVALSATLRTGYARFAYPKDTPANLLFPVSDSEVGSSDATVQIDPTRREVTGSVTSGNFCGYVAPDRRESYYTLHFVAKFDRPFTAGGTWHNGELHKGILEAQGGTGYGDRGFPPGGDGSGAWIRFAPGTQVNMRVGISYVSLANARANLAAESPEGTTLEAVHEAAVNAWNKKLEEIAVTGGTKDERTVFYTALYHVLLEPNLYSDVNRQYLGFDGKVHRVAAPQQAQYANFSGWDVYRSQVQLLTWLDPRLGADIAQSLLNQANQNGGTWDRWTHLTGATSVMNGDPSAPAIAAIYAFGGRDFDVKDAYASLLKAATMPTEKDLSRKGCPVLCVGERPGLNDWLTLHYMPVGAPGWGSAADTLELAAADFGVAQLARDVGDTAVERRFLARAGWWRNLFNPNAAPEGGYIQPRNADGSWKSVDFSVEDDDNYVEGSGAQYLWMIPFDPAGLFAELGGTKKAARRLDRFFHKPDGSLAVTKAGDAHAELDNEPSIASPWLYDFAGEPWKTQELVRAAMKRIWTNTPDGISGNDDLGEMSSWYVWAALGMYPLYPGRAEFVLGSPLFERVVVDRPGARVTIDAKGAAIDAPYVTGLSVNGRPSTKPWLPESFARKGGNLSYTMSRTADPSWGIAPQDTPPSFGPPN